MIKINVRSVQLFVQLAFVEERRARGYTYLEGIQESDNGETMAENGKETSNTTEKGNKVQIIGDKGSVRKNKQLLID